MAENQNKLWIWWIVAIVLVVCVAVLAIQCVSYFQQCQVGKPTAPQEQAAPPTKPHADRRYLYAGNPRPLPSFQGQIQILTNKAFLVGYDNARKDPVWTGYRLFKVSNMQAPKRPELFTVDDRTSARVSSTDYTGSGFDRGHSAPSLAIGVCYGQAAQLETFLMSNIVPQRPKFNRGVWNNLEQMEIRKYAQELEEIWVLTGGVFEGTNHLASGIDVPSACYKIILDEVKGKSRVLAFIMGQNINGADDFANYLTSVDMIEQKTGLDFLGDLPDDVEDKLESQVAGRMW